jgi:hypothetical protein
VARLSLGLAVMPCLVGCFDAPPQYSEPDRVPPVIAADLCDPPVTSLFVSDDEPALLDVAFRADDAGRKVAACFVRDFGTGADAFVDQQPAIPDPRPFAAQTIRDVSTKWYWKREGVQPGCYTVTAVVADQNDFSGKCVTGSDHSLKEARVTWYVWLRESKSDPAPTIDCFGARQ